MEDRVYEKDLNFPNTTTPSRLKCRTTLPLKSVRAQWSKNNNRCYVWTFEVMNSPKPSSLGCVKLRDERDGDAAASDPRASEAKWGTLRILTDRKRRYKATSAYRSPFLPIANNAF